MANGRPVQLTLGGGVTRKKPKPPRRSEKALQAQTRQTLANVGWLSMEAGNSRTMVPCPKCGWKFFPGGSQGNTKGFPDLVFYRSRMEGLFFPIELKGDGTEVDPVQEMLAKAGVYPICYSPFEILEQLKGRLEYLLTLDPKLVTGWIEQIQRFINENEKALR